MADKKIRSAVKGLLWRGIATIDTTLLSFIVTGDIRISTSIGGMELITKTLLYYFHERAWKRIRWGTTDHPPIPAP